MTDLEVRYVGRFEWEQVLRRMRIAGLIGGSGKLGKTGRPTKGGVSAPLFMAIALTLASYGTLDGTEIYPGDAVVAVDVECSIKSVRAVRGKLSELGMLTHIRNPRARRGEEWRLSLPVEFPASIDIMTPAQHKIAAKKMRTDARGNYGGSNGPPAADDAEAVSGGPTDHPHYEDDLQSGGSNGPTETDFGGSVGPAFGGSVGPAYQTSDPATADQANSDETFTGSTTDREGDAASDDNSDADVIDLEARRAEREAAEIAAVAAKLSPSRCEAHKLPAAQCILCRRGLPGRTA